MLRLPARHPRSRAGLLREEPNAGSHCGLRWTEAGNQAHPLLSGLPDQYVVAAEVCSVSEVWNQTDAGGGG